MTKVEPRDLAALLDDMRRIKGEPDLIEAKSGRGGYPKSVVDSMVSFANTRGGTVLIGIDEKSAFEVVGVEEPAAYREAAYEQARNGVVPPAAIEVDIVEVSGRQVVVIEVAEADAEHKPLHVHSKGPTTGALMRTGDGDRRMTAAEVGLLYAARTQPRFDREPVLDARVEDLDMQAIRRTLERIRSTTASLRSEDERTVLRRLGVTTSIDGGDVPTLAGMLAFGTYPQEWFPQLMVTFASFAPEGSEERFLDNVSIRGSVPAMIGEAVAAVRRNLAARATVSGAGRSDHLDFSLEAVREGVANALIHRDYSGITRGSQVQVELYPDRLIVRSPGGLYGPVAVEDLGEPLVSSSRNAVLVSLLADTFIPGTDRLVAENRASGIPVMVRESRQLGQPRPKFKSTVSAFTVELSNSALLSAEVRAWIDVLALPHSSREQDIALAMLFRDSVTNEMLREWGMDRLTAGAVLRNLVDAGIAVRHGGRRYASYVLADAALPGAVRGRPEEDAPSWTRRSQDLPSSKAVFAVLREEDVLSAQEIARRTGLSRKTVSSVLRAAIDDGDVIAHGAPRSPKRTYSLWT